MSKSSKKEMDFKEYTLLSSLFMKSEETTIEDFIEQVYDNKKLYKWFNTFPYIWISADRDYFDKGCVATFHMIFPLFSYKIKCEEVLPNNRGFILSFSGLLTGKGKFEFIKKDNGILFVHEFHVKGINKFVHSYFGSMISGHAHYMKWRFSKLKKILIKNLKKEKLGGA